MSQPTYFDIVESVDHAQAVLNAARAASGHDANEVLDVCQALLNLVEMLNQKDAPE